MATITINSLPAIITEAEVAPVENILQITPPNYSSVLLQEYMIEVITGTYQFAAGIALTAENPTYTAGDKVIISLKDGLKLRYLATAQNDSFKISV